MAAPLGGAAHFRDEFRLIRFSFTFVISVCLLCGMSFATRIWNLLSFMEENLFVPFMYLVLNIARVRFYTGCWIQFF